MTDPYFELDRKGILEWMRENLADDTRAAAEAMADTVRSERAAATASNPKAVPVEVDVKSFETDRPHEVVMIRKYGAALEAKHGYLHRAATSLGLDVRPDKKKG